MLLTTLWPAVTWAQETPQCPVSDKPASRVQASKCGASTVLCPYRACGGIKGVTCFVSFGLYRGVGSVTSSDFRCPPRKRVFSLTDQWVRSDDYLERIIQARLLSIRNENSIALSDQMINSLNDMVKRVDDVETPFYVVIRNDNDTEVEVKLYTLFGHDPIDGVYDDGDRTLWERSTVIFNELRSSNLNYGGLDEHLYKIAPKETIMRGVVPGVPAELDKGRFYAVGLFSAQAPSHFQLDASDILVLGLVSGSRH